MDALLRRWLNGWRRSSAAIIQECCEQSWTGPGSNTPQGHLPPITKTIQAWRTRHAGHCWRSKDEIVSDVLLWTPAYGQSKAGRPARTFIQKLCEVDRTIQQVHFSRRWLLWRRLEFYVCTIVVYWPSTRANMPFQSDASEGSDTFRWQLWEEIA